MKDEGFAVIMAVLVAMGMFCVGAIGYCFRLSVEKELRQELAMNMALRNRIEPDSFIYVCRRMPPLGTYGWSDWLKKYGECEMAQ